MNRHIQHKHTEHKLTELACMSNGTLTAAAVANTAIAVGL